MEIRTIKKTKEDTNGKIIRSREIAKKLLQTTPPNVIIDLKIDKNDPTGARTVFVFEKTEQFEADFSRIVGEAKKARWDEAVEREVEARLKKLHEENSQDEPEVIEQED